MKQHSHLKLKKECDKDVCYYKYYAVVLFNKGCFISKCHFMATYVSIIVEDMKTKLFLKKKDLNFMQQKVELKNQKRFIKLSTNV